MMKKQVALTKEMVEAFIMHPDWLQMQLFIEQHFDNSTEIETIDVSNSSTTVHAEVIARQHIDRDVKSLMKSFDTTRANFGKTKKSYE